VSICDYPKGCSSTAAWVAVYGMLDLDDKVVPPPYFLCTEHLIESLRKYGDRDDAVRKHVIIKRIGSGEESL